MRVACLKTASPLIPRVSIRFEIRNHAPFGSTAAHDHTGSLTLWAM
ncbi:MAG: hypothetical protein QXI64_06075 [Sulfolobales archaeon]